MLCTILSLTVFTFLVGSAAKTSEAELTDLQKFLKKVDEDYQKGGLSWVHRDLEEEWRKFKESGKFESSSELSDLHEFLKKLESEYRKHGVEKVYQHLEDEWQQYISQTGKAYSGQEKAKRKSLFMEHEVEVEGHNALYDEGKSSYKMGLNQMADMTDAEINKLNDLIVVDNETIMASLPYANHPRRLARQANVYPMPFKHDKSVRLPQSIDWREKGYVSPVQQQGQCGSCYAFAAAGALEAYYKRVTGTLYKLSEQNVIDCTWKYGNNGCNGGALPYVYQYAQSSGIVTSQHYPYTSDASRQCKFNQQNALPPIGGYVMLPSGDEEALKYAVATAGPVSVAMSASSRGFMFYKSGVFATTECGPVNHGVLVVGYGVDPKFGDYWIIKNSWGPSWGMKGYAYVARNRNNMCNIATQASYPDLRQ